MPSVQDLLDSCDTLFSLPEIYLRVRDVVDNPASTMDDLAAVLALDPAITVRVLRIVNSPMYGLPRQIGTLPQAVGLLGMQHIQDIVLSTSVTKSFPNIQSTVMNMTDFWRRSVRCGLLAHSLAQAARVEHAEAYFIIGLLRDIGHLVLYQTIPDRAQSALVESAHLLQPLAEVEQENIGCDFTEIGAELMRRWGMPDYFELAIGGQVAPDPADPAQIGALVINRAGHLSDRVELDGVEAVAAAADVQTLLHPLGVDEALCLPELLEKAEGGLQEMLAVIFPPPLANAA